jgi:hypothetical protein
MKTQYVIFVLFLLVSGSCSNKPKKSVKPEVQVKEQTNTDLLDNAAFENAVSKYYSERKVSRKQDSLLALERIKYDTLYSCADSVITIKGIIQSSGIRKEYELGIQADFQITNPQKSFFLVTSKDLSPYWGKCVSVKGRFIKGWDADMSKYNFNISAINLDSINSISSNYCFNSPVFQPVNNKKYKIEKRDTTVRGVIVRSKRMSPDIDYDYRLKLEKPVYNLDDGWGETSNFFLSINMDIDSLNNIIENNRRVTLYGMFTGGYVETTLFLCKKVIDCSPKKKR